MTFRRLDERQIYNGHIIEVVVGRFAGPDGQQFERDIVRHPGAVAIVPLDGEEIVLVEQYRSPIDAPLIEIPAGLRDVEDEPLQATARRELREEVGLEADRFEPLTQVHNAPGFSDELIHIYLATGLTAVERPVTDSPEEAEMRILRVRVPEAIEMVRDGRITDSKTIIGVLALRALR